MTTTRDMSVMRYYFTSLSSLLRQPKVFFSQLPDPCSARLPLIFLLMSGAVATAASLLGAKQPNSPVGGAIFFANAVGLAAILAAFGYLVLRLAFGKKIPFGRVFSVYALASGLVIHAAWLPHFWIFTEPWKWWLIAVGMMQACNLRASQALAVIGMSAGIWMLVVWSILPLTAA